MKWAGVIMKTLKSGQDHSMCFFRIISRENQFPFLFGRLCRSVVGGPIFSACFCSAYGLANGLPAVRTAGDSRGISCLSKIVVMTAFS